MTAVHYSTAMPSAIATPLRQHLLKHIARGQRQEDLCFCLWRPSKGADRSTALLVELVLPREGERRLTGNVSFLPNYFERAVGLALERGAGLAFLHSHFTPGWQGMSPDDVLAEERL